MAGYTRTTWARGRAGNTPLNPERLNNLEEGVEGAWQSSESYDGSGSYQSKAADLELAAAAGAGPGDSAFLAPFMGNVISTDMSKRANYVFGEIGAYSVTGTNAAELGRGALAGIIMDGVTNADGAVVAVIDGSDPSSATRVNAMFKAMMNNNNASSGADYGIDLMDAGRASDIFTGGGKALAYAKADVRMPNEVCVLQKAGAPINGGSGTGVGVAGPGSLCIDRTNGVLYINTNTKASPTWTKVGTQS